MPRQASKRSQAAQNVAQQGPSDETADTTVSSTLSGSNVGSEQNVVGDSAQNKKKRSRRAGNVVEGTTITENLANVRVSYFFRYSRPVLIILLVRYLVVSLRMLKMLVLQHLKHLQLLR
jgi:hypothetical protein